MDEHNHLVSTLITVGVSVFGSGGLVAVYTAWVNSKRNKSQSETERRAQLTNEFGAIVGTQKEQLKRLDERILVLERQVVELRSEHRSAEDYIDVLIVGISNGTIPPIPPRI